MRRLAAAVLAAAVWCPAAVAAARPFVDSSPLWSPDGSRLLVGRVLELPRQAPLYSAVLVRPDGSHAAVLPDVLGGIFSPDGRSLLLTRSVDQITSYVSVRDVASGRERQVQAVALDEDGRGWTPDGSRIVVLRKDGLYSELRNGADARALGPRGKYLTASLLPGGRDVVLSTSRAVSVAPASAGTARRLTPAGTWWLSAPSPDGRRLLLVHDGSLWLVPVDGSAAPRRLAAGSGGAWSRDGRRIALTGPRGIFVVGADGRGLRRIRAAGTDPAWSPDGRRIAFADNRGCPGAGVYVMRADGSGERQLTHACRR